MSMMTSKTEMYMKQFGRSFLVLAILFGISFGFLHMTVNKLNDDGSFEMPAEERAEHTKTVNALAYTTGAFAALLAVFTFVSIVHNSQKM